MVPPTLSILLLLFLTLITINPIHLVGARKPDKSRKKFLFLTNTDEEESNEDDFYNVFYGHYYQDQNGDDGDYDDALDEEEDEEESERTLVVKEYDPNIIQSLTDDVYNQHSFNEIEEIIRIIPSFLEPSTMSLLKYTDTHRIILWYNPYCEHCQRFKFKYLGLAQEVHQLVTNVGGGCSTSSSSIIEFHAISCSAHHCLCDAYDIIGFPIIWVYRKNSTDFQILEDYTVTAMTNLLKISPNLSNNDDGIKKTNQPKDSNKMPKDEHDIALESISSSSSNFSEDFEEDTENEVIDILGASNDIHKRTRNDVFHDTAMSFMHFINLYDNEVEKEGTLLEYYDLLYWSLPPSWKIYTIVNEIRQSMKESKVQQSSTGKSAPPIETISLMQNAVQSHKSFVLDGRFQKKY